jgi:ADP-ribose pyrophosphatase
VRRDDVRCPTAATPRANSSSTAARWPWCPWLDDGRLVLVRQYRYPVAKVLLEWPAGKRDAGRVHAGLRDARTGRGDRLHRAEWAYGGEIHNAAAYHREHLDLVRTRPGGRSAKRPTPASSSRP